MGCGFWLTLIGGLFLTAAVAAGLIARSRIAQAREQRVKVDSMTIYAVVERYSVEHAGEPCPTVEKLLAARELSAGTNIHDPWGTPYKIVCRGEEVIIVSFGPDTEGNTADDLRFPVPPPTEGR